MRRSKEDAAQTRARAVRAAAQLFRARGFEGVGLKDIMHAIGMTHGGFYRHFASKDALATEAVAAASEEVLTGQRACAQSLAPGEAFRGFIEGYLSAEHVAHPERGCPLAALATDGGRQPAPTRQAFTSAIAARLAALEAVLPEGATRRQRALQTLASIVGAVVLARATTDPALAQEILEGVRAGVLAPP
jgi:TetR/AcrR family transcriptional regulator, transcriptional repressor for nem operon